MRNRMTHTEWQETILQSYIKKHHPPKSEVEHILDFLDHNSEFKVSTRLSYLAMKKRAEEWTERLNKKNKNLKESGEVTTILNFKDGMNFVHLKDQVAKDWEGKHMGHCVASYRDHCGIYSLRDEENIPHCTVEVSHRSIRQIKGKSNGKVAQKYHIQVMAGLKQINCELRGSDLENIGYRPVSPNNLKTLTKYFTGTKVVESSGVRYIYPGLPLKLSNPIVSFDPDLYSLFSSPGLNCLEALEKLLTLRPKTPKDSSHFNEFFEAACSQGDVEVAKLLFPKLSKSDIIKRVISEDKLVKDAVECENIKLVKFLIEKYKAAWSEFKSTNPLSSHLEVRFLESGFGAALARGSSELCLYFLEQGAKVQAWQLGTLCTLAAKSGNKTLLEISLIYLNPQEKFLKGYLPALFLLISRGRENLAEMFIEKISPYWPKRNIAAHLYDHWSSTNSPEMLEFIIKNFGFEEKDYQNMLFNCIELKKPKTLETFYEMAKRGANLGLERGRLLVEALKADNYELAVALIAMGLLGVADISRLPQSTLVTLARVLGRADNLKEEAYAFLDKVMFLDNMQVIKILNDFGIVTPEQQARIERENRINEAEHLRKWKRQETIVKTLNHYEEELIRLSTQTKEELRDIIQMELELVSDTICALDAYEDNPEDLIQELCYWGGEIEEDESTLDEFILKLRVKHFGPLKLNLKFIRNQCFSVTGLK